MFEVAGDAQRLGRRHLPQHLAGLGIDDGDHDFPGLSQRESEVLVLIGRGLSNQEIAEQLYVSVNSVKTYIRQVYAKTGATRRTQAVAWAHEHGWTE